MSGHVKRVCAAVVNGERERNAQRSNGCVPAWCPADRSTNGCGHGQIASMVEVKLKSRALSGGTIAGVSGICCSYGISHGSKDRNRYAELLDAVEHEER